MSSLRGGKRKEFPIKVRKLAFARCCKDGVPHCESCGIGLNARSGFIYEHIVPDGLQGEPTLENCGVWCRTCSGIKTETDDNPRMAKADRVARKEFGLQPTRKKIQSRGFRKAAPQRTASRPIERQSYE